MIEHKHYIDRQTFEKICKEQKADPSYETGIHAIALIEIDHYQKVQIQQGIDGMELLMKQILRSLASFADRDTMIVRYNDLIIAVVMHHLDTLEQLRLRCTKMHEAIRLSSFVGVKYTTSIGVALCHHDQQRGYRCAFDQALHALGQAQTIGNHLVFYTPSEKEKKTRVLIVEDQQMPAQLFRSIVQNSRRYTLTETIQSAQAAYFYCAQGKVDLVLMDVVTMMGANGLQAAKRIKQAFPQIKIIIVTSMPEASWLKKAREYGMDSFWYKEVQTESLMEIMDRTMAGESVYPATSPMVQLGDTTSDELSQRELEILRELTTGATNTQISAKMHIATSTVKTYVDRLMEKTGYHSRTELAVRARETGLVIHEIAEE